MKKFMSLLFGVLLVVGYLSLNHSTDPTCTPTDPEEPVCVVASDCEGLTHVQCVGHWECVEGSCNWECSLPDEVCNDGIDNDGDGLTDEECLDLGDECEEDYQCKDDMVCMVMTVVPNPPKKCQIPCDSDDECPDGYSCFLPGPGFVGGATHYCKKVENSNNCKTDDDCKEGYFCKMPDGVCNSDEAIGTCTIVPFDCAPGLYEPVCGCNGVTYQNYCVAMLAKVSILHDGKCEENNECTDFFACKTDDDCIKVNKGCCPCEMGGQSIAINKKCEKEWIENLDCPENVMCPAVYLCNDSQPVCENGKCVLTSGGFIQ